MSAVMLILAKFWREALIVAVILGAWRWVMVERAQRGKAEGEAALAKSRAVIAESTAASCDAALAEQKRAVGRWQLEAMIAASAVDGAKDRVSGLQREHAEQVGRLAPEIEQLKRELERLPEADRCEAALEWAQQRYQEVAGGR